MKIVRWWRIVEVFVKTDTRQRENLSFSTNKNDTSPPTDNSIPQPGVHKFSKNIAATSKF